MPYMKEERGMSRQIEVTIGRLLYEMAQRYPDNDALVYPERGLRYSYRQFNEVCRQVAKGLLKLGVKKGDHLAIWAYNVPEWAILQYATPKIGAVLVPSTLPTSRPSWSMCSTSRTPPRCSWSDPSRTPTT